LLLHATNSMPSLLCDDFGDHHLPLGFAALASPLPLVPLNPPLAAPPLPAIPPRVPILDGAGVENLGVGFEDVGGLSTKEVSVVLIHISYSPLLGLEGLYKNVVSPSISP